MARGKPSEPPAGETFQSSSSGLTVSVTVGPTPENSRPKYGRITRLLLSIPEPWLDRWGLKINAGCSLFTLLWALGSLGLSLGGVFRGWGLTPAQGTLVQVGWIPVMMVSMFVVSARFAHALAHLQAQQEMLRQMDEGLAEMMASAVHEGVSRAAQGAPAGERGPTIQ